MACMKRLGHVLASTLLVVTVLASNAGTSRAQDAETAATVFHDHISKPISPTERGRTTDVFVEVTDRRGPQ